MARCRASLCRSTSIRTPLSAYRPPINPSATPISHLTRFTYFESPVVAERIPLVEAARAHELIERGGYAGKVVLVAGV